MVVYCDYYGAHQQRLTSTVFAGGNIDLYESNYEFALRNAMQNDITNILD